MKALLILIFLAGCANMSPEAQLLKGYQTASGTVRTTTVLVNRQAISTDDASRVLSLGQTAKATLDAGKEKLKQCRATAGADCSNAALTIDLGSNVLMDLENYLKAHQ